MSIGANRGVAYGLINTVAVALAIGVWSRGSQLWLAVMLMWFMLLPAGIIGWALGAIADRLRGPVAVRVAVLVVPPTLFVQLCAEAFRLAALAPAVIVPTVVCALLLERATRPTPPLTPAIALSR
ncbi:MAG: hypothetical protein JNK64_12740 [Myxococcales bacterium]|nr:hypothetical protein [Myxococcales bacterium]